MNQTEIAMLEAFRDWAIENCEHRHKNPKLSPPDSDGWRFEICAMCGMIIGRVRMSTDGNNDILEMEAIPLDLYL